MAFGFGVFCSEPDDGFEAFALVGDEFETAAKTFKVVVGEEGGEFDSGKFGVFEFCGEVGRVGGVVFGLGESASSVGSAIGVGPEVTTSPRRVGPLGKVGRFVDEVCRSVAYDDVSSSILRIVGRVI